MKKILLSLIAISMMTPSVIFAQANPPAVVTTNLGVLYVGAGAVMYNQGAVKAKNASEINIQGTGKIITTGNFIQDATTPAFKVNTATGLSVSDGTFVF
jgi:hypothetical protein